jgi:RNA polymerase sigma-70 factor (ECF subfamily)
MKAALPEIRAGIVDLLPRLRRFARAVTRHPADADDLVQVTVVHALARAAQWQPGTRLDSWMFRIMKNAWIDEVRATTRRERVLAPEAEGLGVGETSAEQQVDRLAIQEAMRRLPDEQRLVVGLVLIEGLAYREAADILEIPVGTLTSRLGRARETLQAMLSPGEAPA